MRRVLATLTACLGLTIACHSAAATDLAILSQADAQLYGAAFEAAERGDAPAAEAALAQVRDPCLTGHVRYLSLAGPAPRKATYGELDAWLQAFRDLPGAGRIYALAMKLKPAGAHPPAPSAPLIAQAPGDAAPIPASRVSPAARQAYFGGDLARARAGALADGDRWIAGLAAYRLGRYADAIDDFSAMALDASAGDDMRAAGAFWAARAAGSAGAPADVDSFLRVAASAPDTFYGMIARRRLELDADPLGRLLDPSAAPQHMVQPISTGGFDAPGVRDLIRLEPRARRAIALMQIGRPLDAGLELRAGIALSADDEERAAWTTLVLALNPEHPLATGATRLAPRAAAVVYPTPRLDPLGGFILNRALVYALTWQESRFDSLAVSHAGAIGLMQVMPKSMADITGDDSLLSDPIPLFDPATNLRAGQQYVLWLQQRAVGPDLLDVIAAYNGGPGEVARAHSLLGVNDDLLLVESLPYAETRDYVRKVMAAYWSYRRQFGADSPSLDAMASGAQLVDATLDR
jgi:soluble lytic murein transglycosylase-like protein